MWGVTMGVLLWAYQDLYQDLCEQSLYSLTMTAVARPPQPMSASHPAATQRGMRRTPRGLAAVGQVQRWECCGAIPFLFVTHSMYAVSCPP